jgi:tetratricopeptide (TPR) repeat protein
MTRHPRIPAILATLLSGTLGVALLAGTGQFRTRDLGAASVEELEKRIVGSTDGPVWEAYGDKLRAAGRFSSAAKAYDRALAFAPDLVGARLHRAVALAQAGETDVFFAYFGKLSITYPKLASDLLDRPELASLHKDPRWDPAAASARAQAID